MATPFDRDRFLAEPHVAILATVGPGSRPHAMPVWYLYEGGEFIVLTGRGSQKHRNVERVPDVSLVMDRRELPYYAVMVQATAEVGEAPSVDLLRRLAQRYLGDAAGAAYAASRQAADSVTLRLRPRKFVEYRGVSGQEATGD